MFFSLLSRVSFLYCVYLNTIYRRSTALSADVTNDESNDKEGDVVVFQ